MQKEGNDTCVSNKRKRPLDDDCNQSNDLRVIYINDNNLLLETSKIPNIGDRGLVVAKLIESYKLLQWMETLESVPASEEDLQMFHASSYVDHLKTVNEDDEIDDDSNFGLGYDCPLVKDIFEFACRVAGSTLTAAKALNSRKVDIAINWSGGWHHAQRDEAEGFCYVNDVVLGIEELKKVHNTILYIDLDVHHGNGVENAFAFTKKVLTLSFHQYGPGFYPCSGSLDDIGLGLGKYYTVNVPLHEGISDSVYCSVFDRVANAVHSSFIPGAVVVQCGADGLAKDPIGEFNLTNRGYGRCVQTILGWRKPTLFLGGGGYNIQNTARCWTYITSLIVGKEISTNIPDKFDYFVTFGPDFELDVTPTNRKDYNTPEYIDEVVSTILSNLKEIGNTNRISQSVWQGTSRI